MKTTSQKKISSVLLLLLAASFLLSACGNKEAANASAGNDGLPEVTELRYQGWTGSVSFPELAEDLGYLAPLEAEIYRQYDQRASGYSIRRYRRYRLWRSL